MRVWRSKMYMYSHSLFWDDTSSYDANICFWLPQFHGLNLIFHKVPFTTL